MSIYPPKGNRKTWGYEFQFQNIRYCKSGFKDRIETECASQEHRAFLKGEPYTDEWFKAIQQRRRPFSVLFNEQGCILFRSNLGKGGYPVISWNGKRTRVSRLIYEKNFGPVPPGTIIRHKCDNPPCINPLHLEVGTHGDNQADKVKRGRQAKGEKNGRARLTEQDVQFILQTHFSERELSDKYHVDRTTIRAIRQGKTWRYLQESGGKPENRSENGEG